MAYMGVLRVDHPDILEFVSAKGKLDDRNENVYDKIKKFLTDEQNKYFEQVLLDEQFRNFNISIAITDKFMKALENNEEYELINPRNNEIWGVLPAKEVWNKIINMAYKNGEPGLVFIDKINRKHPAPEKIESVNVCGRICLI